VLGGIMEVKLRAAMARVKTPFDFIDRPVAFILFTLILIVLATHILIATLRFPGLLLASALDILTFGRIANLKVRRRMLVGLIRYYNGVIRTGNWLSARALANQLVQA